VDLADVRIRELKAELASTAQLRGHFGALRRDEKELGWLREGIARSLGFSFFMYISQHKDLNLLELVGQEVEGRDNCPDCGQRVPFVITTIGDKFTVKAKTRCRYAARGYPEIKTSLKVPSGLILLFNDFREYYGGDDIDTNINTMPGEAKYVREFAKRGLVTIAVGNTCPAVYQPNKTKLVIGSGISGKHGRKIDDICTDLWRYCAVDHDDFVRRAGMSLEQFQKQYCDLGNWPVVVQARVTPGVYTVTGRYHLCRDACGEFSTIELR